MDEFGLEIFMSSVKYTREWHAEKGRFLVWKEKLEAEPEAVVEV